MDLAAKARSCRGHIEPQVAIKRALAPARRRDPKLEHTRFAAEMGHHLERRQRLCDRSAGHGQKGTRVVAGDVEVERQASHGGGLAQLASELQLAARSLECARDLERY